jgi:hypothetical protein
MSYFKTIKKIYSLRVLRVHFQECVINSQVKSILKIRQITSLTLHIHQMKKLTLKTIQKLCNPSLRLEYYDLTLGNLNLSQIDN